MKNAGNKLFLWVGLAFALLIAVWIVWIVIASRHPVAGVPFAAGPNR